MAAGVCCVWGTVGAAESPVSHGLRLEKSDTRELAMSVSMKWGFVSLVQVRHRSSPVFIVALRMKGWQCCADWGPGLGHESKTTAESNAFPFMCLSGQLHWYRLLFFFYCDFIFFKEIDIEYHFLCLVTTKWAVIFIYFFALQYFSPFFACWLFVFL